MYTQIYYVYTKSRTWGILNSAMLVARQPFPSASKWTKGHNIQCHRGLSEEISDSWIPLSHLSRSQKQRWTYLGEICEGTPCLMDWIAGTHWEDSPDSFLRILYQQKQHQLKLKSQRRQDEKRQTDYPTFTGKKQAGKRLSANIHLRLWQRKDGSKGRALSPEQSLRPQE